ncbi:MAG TPA: hypothetical protein VFP10_12410 [Candidatus Eisenbacteria bacterium]|nr:hypothetical protein [Candidatus Eisenbacteria bacterium]
MEQRRQAANARVRLSERAARTVLRDGPIRRSTRQGEVIITDVAVATTSEGLEYLEIRSDPGANGETHWRIFNPPVGVLRPDGSIEESPVEALAEVLALHGGAVRRKRRRTVQ